MSTDTDAVDNLCRGFLEADSYKDACGTFMELCDLLDIDRSSHDGFYLRIRDAILPFSSFKKGIWRLLDARASHEEYMNGDIGKGKSVLIVGAGPCGLRMAIECALLGAKVVVIEMRDYISRNNVLHLWPFVIQDMKSIGAKEFYPQFANGSLNHVSIRKMQLMLLKIALILGVEIHAPVRFIDLVEPSGDDGWKVTVSPAHNIVNDYEFDVVIGANGARNTLKGFRRKNPFRGKLAIAITANFVNRQTKEDVSVEEIPGIFSFMNPEFFGLLKSKGFDLENFVYYQDETHYFVLTVKKGSLLRRGVLKQDFGDSASLLAADNIDKGELIKLSREIAQIATENQIPDYQYAQTHRGEDDVAVFDFTVMYQAENSVLAREVNGKKLLTSIIGDSLINPFWPRGTGCAHGFLGVFDTAWLIRNWFEGSRPDMETICEREKLYSLLSQSSPNNLKQNFRKYTIDPKTRYSALILPTAKAPENPEDLFLRGRQTASDVPIVKPAIPPKPIIPTTKPSKRPKGSGLETVKLLTWYQEKLIDHQDVAPVTDLNDSWRNGMAFCALLTVYRPELMDVTKLDPSNVLSNTTQAFELIEREFEVSPILSPLDLVSPKPLDSLAMLSYLACLHQELKQTPTHTRDKGRDGYLSADPVKCFKKAKGAIESTRFVAKLLTYMKSKKMKENAKGKFVKAVRRIHMMRALASKGLRSPRISVAAMVRKLSTEQAKTQDLYEHETEREVDTRKVHTELCIDDDNQPSSAQQGRQTHPFNTLYMPSYQTRDPPSRPAYRSNSPTHIDTTTEPSQSPTGRYSSLKRRLEEDLERTAEAPRDEDLWDETSMAGGLGLVQDRLKMFGEQNKYTRGLSSDNCSICDRRLYITDRYSDHGYFFHRQCFKCHVCQVRLYVGSSVLMKDRDENERTDSVDHTKDSDYQTEEVADENMEQTALLSESADDADYQSTASNRLFLGDAIQRGLEEVEEEEGELEERGMEVERSIRGELEEASKEHSAEELMDQWLEVLQRKKDLAEKESRLMIQGMLLELKADAGIKAQLSETDITQEREMSDELMSEEEAEMNLLEHLTEVTRL